MEEIRQADIEAATAINDEALVSSGADWVQDNATEWEVVDNSLTTDLQLLSL